MCPDSVYSPLPELFHNDVLISDLFNQRLRANRERLDRNPMLQRIEQAIIDQGIIVALPDEPRPESLEGATNTLSSGASTKLTPEYTRLMEQIEEIIQQQRNAGGPDAISDAQLFGKNVLLSVERLRLQCRQVVRNLPRTIANETERIYLDTCQQIADSKTLKDVIGALNAVDARRTDVPTQEGVRIQSLLRLGAGIIGYVQRTITRGVVVPLNSVTTSISQGFRDANEELEQERRIESAREEDLEKIKTYIRNVLSKNGFTQNCVELHILSINERLDMRTALVSRPGKLGIHGRARSVPLPSRRENTDERRPTLQFHDYNVDKIVEFLTTEYDLVDKRINIKIDETFFILFKFFVKI